MICATIIFMSEDRYVIIRQSILESEDAVSYAPVKFFSTVDEADHFTAKISGEPGDVLYLCDVAYVSEIPLSFMYCYLFNSKGQLESIGNKRKSYLVNWMSENENAFELIHYARSVGIDKILVSKCVCECIKSVRNLRPQDRAKVIDLADEIYNSKLMEYSNKHTEWTKPIRFNSLNEKALDLQRYALRSNGKDASIDVNLAICSSALMFYNDSRWGDAVDAVASINSDTISVIKGIITMKKFIIALAEMELSNTV